MDKLDVKKGTEMTLKNLIQYLDDISTISNRQNFDIRKLYGDGGNRTRVQAYRHLNLYVHRHTI